MREERLYVGYVDVAAEAAADTGALQDAHMAGEEVRAPMPAYAFLALGT